MHELPVSVIVMTKDEEANIAKCLRSVARFAEVFVVDSASRDRTTAIAERLGARVVPFEWNGLYPKKKQWALDHLPFSHDWVLYLDADEEVTPALGDEIATLLERGPAHNGYFIGFDYVFLGRVLRHGHRVYKLALVQKGRAQFRERDDLDLDDPVEVELHFQPALEGTTATLRERILHHDHDNLFHYFARHNDYSDWEALLRTQGSLLSRDEPQPLFRGTLKRIFARLPFKGTFAFVYSYVLKLGFLDGRAGFHFAVAKAMYYWQVGIKMRERELERGRRNESAPLGSVERTS